MKTTAFGVAAMGESYPHYSAQEGNAVDSF
jgi:hypothetical protein